MSDALVDLGIQDALRYVHVNILPSVVLVCRDVAHIAVISVSCVFFAWSLARASSLFGAAWVFAKAAAALSAFQLVWARVVDPFVYDKTREYVELGKRRRFAAENSAMGSLFSPPSRGAGAIGRGAGTPGKTREDPLAEKRRAVANGGTPGTPGSVAGTPRAGTPAGSRLGSRQNSFRADGLFDGAYAATGAPGRSRPDAAADAALVAAGPSCSAGLRLAAVPVGRRGMPLSALRDGSRVSVELRGGGGDGDGWSEGFLCVHPHKTYETAAVMGALNWGGHQLVVACRGATEAMCRGEVLNLRPPSESEKENDTGANRGGALFASAPRGARASAEAHERDVARFVFRVHLFGSGREITLRNEGTGTLVTTFVSGVKFERRRVVAWHKQRSSKVLTASSTMFSPPEGGAWEELALVPVRRTKLGLVPAEDDGETSESCEFAFCRPREGTFWKHDAGDDGMMAFTKTLAEASPFRLHDADAGEAFFSDHRRRD